MGNLDNILTTNPAVFQIVDFFEKFIGFIFIYNFGFWSTTKECFCCYY